MKEGELKAIVAARPPVDTIRAGWVHNPFHPRPEGTKAETRHIPVGSPAIILEIENTDQNAEEPAYPRRWVRALTSLGPLWFFENAIGDL